MSWRPGSAFAPLSAAGGGAITVTTTTAIAAGERAILVVFRQQAASGTALGSPVVSTLGGSAFTTLAAREEFGGTSEYTGLSFHSFVASGLIASGATFTVTPGHVNQKVAAMLLVQADPHPTEAPFADVQNGSPVGPGTIWPGFPYKKMDWDKRLLIAAYTGSYSGTATPWSSVFVVTSTPLNGYIEALDATQFAYGFGINVREQDTTDSELSPESAGNAANGAYGQSPSQGGMLTLVRAGAVQPSLSPNVFEYNDFPSRNLPGSGSKPAVGQLWPR